MSTKRLTNIKQVVGFIIIYWNCDGFLKGRCVLNTQTGRHTDTDHATCDVCRNRPHLSTVYRQCSLSLIIMLAGYIRGLKNIWFFFLCVVAVLVQRMSTANDVLEVIR